MSYERIYSYADAAALDEAEGLYDYRHPVGDYRHLAPAYSYSYAWERDLDLPACLPERAEGFSIADEPRRCWPAPDLSKQRRLL
jgi:hypothetical protein